MLESTFLNLPESLPDRKQIGQIYLEGEHMISQKTSKHKGDIVSYYEIITVYNPKKYEFVPKYEKLE